MNIFSKSISSIGSISEGCVNNLIAPLWVVTALAIAACVPSTPVQHFASENAISLKYSAYDSVPTLTAEALDMAAQHCKKYGKHTNYKGGNAANSFSTEEIHRFACEDKKTDDSEVIAAQSQRPAQVVAPSYQAPTQTSCTTVGGYTNCHSY